jgi:hypothetical protein
VAGTNPSTNVCVFLYIFHTQDLSLHSCDADPEALADYVLALLKHDAPEPELRKMFVSQLEEFLEKGTVSPRLGIVMAGNLDITNTRAQRPLNL